MTWIQGGIDVVKDVGDLFSDFGGGSDSEEESESGSESGYSPEEAMGELNDALESGTFNEW